MDPTVSKIRLFTEAGDLGGKRLGMDVTVAPEGDVMFVLLLLENPCCDLIDTVVAVEALEGDLAMAIGVEDGTEELL